MTNAVNLASAAGTGFFRNKLINGGMEVAQRGTTFVNPAGVYTLDRWYATCSNCNLAQVSFGPNKALSFNYTSSTNSGFIDQPLESSTVKQINGKTVTFSFYAASSTGAPTVAIQIYKNATADTRTGGAWTLISTSNVTISTSYTRYSLTVTIPNDGTANGVLPLIIPAANQPNGSAIYVSQIQLEEGSAATPFENRPYGLELALCQRFFYKQPRAIVFGFGSFYLLNTAFPVEMRATPTLSLTTTAPYFESSPWATVGSWSSASANNGHMTSRGGDVQLNGTFNSINTFAEIGDDIIRFNAELS